jgi:hypothetical protein
MTVKHHFAERSKKMPPTTYPLKIQAIRSRGQQPRLYVSFPLALATAIDLNPGDQVQWELLDRGELHLVRLQPPAPAAKHRSLKKPASL